MIVSMCNGAELASPPTAQVRAWYVSIMAMSHTSDPKDHASSAQNDGHHCPGVHRWPTVLTPGRRHLRHVAELRWHARLLHRWRAGAPT